MEELVAPVDHSKAPGAFVLRVVLLPWQISVDGAGMITGVGGVALTITDDMVCVKHTPAVAVMVKVVVCATVVLSFNDPEMGVPEPFVLMPAMLVVLSLDQVKAV